MWFLNFGFQSIDLLYNHVETIITLPFFQFSANSLTTSSCHSPLQALISNLMQDLKISGTIELFFGLQNEVEMIKMAEKGKEILDNTTNVLGQSYLGKSKEENVAIFRRYIAEISCIGEYRHDISWRNIGPTIFQDKSREIGNILRYISDLAINRRFFPIYRMVNTSQRKSNALQ